MHGGAVVTHLSPTSEVGGSNPRREKDGSFLPMVGSLQYATLTELYALVSSAHKTTLCDLTYIVLKAT